MKPLFNFQTQTNPQTASLVQRTSRGFCRANDMATIALTGQGGGKVAPLATVLLDVPSRSTPLVQQVQMQICLYHYFCKKVEERLA